MKSILLIDTPKRCGECPLTRYCLDIAEDKKATTMEIIRGSGWFARLKNCPLKPMPKKIPFDEAFKMEDYSIGWNACIGEILGEIE